MTHDDLWNFVKTILYVYRNGAILHTEMNETSLYGF